jgi:hypothetical protein
VAPLLVTVDPARTPKFAAAPKLTGSSPAIAGCCRMVSPSRNDVKIGAIVAGLENMGLDLSRCIFILLWRLKVFDFAVVNY